MAKTLGVGFGFWIGLAGPVCGRVGQVEHHPADHPSLSSQVQAAEQLPGGQDFTAFAWGKVTFRPDGLFEFFSDFSDPAQLDDWIIREPQAEWAVEGGRYIHVGVVEGRPAGPGFDRT